MAKTPASSGPLAGPMPQLPDWVAWMQAGLTALLAVLFLVMLAKAREQNRQIEELQETANSVAQSVWDFRPGGKMSPSVAVKLMGENKNNQVRTLREAGMPATADLIDSLKEAP